jgi:hypothetical protein
MAFDASSLRREGIGELEAIFHEKTRDPRVLVALRNELKRRNAPQARELFGKVVEQLAIMRHAKPWYLRGGVWLGGLVVAGIVQGIFHAAGFHMWEPLWRVLQNAGRQVGLF